MAIDTDRALALTFEPLVVLLERGRLRRFAEAIGETDPVHRDVEAARAAGHPDVVAPPTYLFSIELEAPRPFAFVEDLGIDLMTILHGEQSFTYHSLIHAGDTITVRRRIVDASAKTPTMDFLVRRSEFYRGHELVGEADSLTIVRTPVAA
jgi:acyl dehydratase